MISCRWLMHSLSHALERPRLAAMRKFPGLCLLLLLLFLVAALINPVREMMVDDDWAYGLTVRHLLATGKYHLNDWAAANMPAQIYWAAFLAQIFGYSFTILRFSSLILLIFGIIALYCLLRDFGVPDNEASLLIFAVLSSPAVLFLSFTFQTDVQFLGWQILALWLYTRGLSQESPLLMAVASVAACAAIGTRQFGVALVAGLLATWIIFEQQRVRKTPLYLIGLVLPLLVTFWQFTLGVSRATFTQKVRLAEQVAYMRDFSRLGGDVLWRPTVILQYVGLFLLPLLPLLVLLVRNTWTGREPPKSDGAAFSRSDLWLAGVWIMYLIAGVCIGYFFYLPRILMPYLAWLLPNAQTSPFGFKRHLALTLLTAGFAVLFGWLLSRRYLDRQNWQRLSTAEWFVVLSGMALLGLQLVYAQFYDVYLIQFLPFAVFALGKMAPTWPRWCKGTTATLCLVMLSVSSLWTRGTLARAEASWRAAEIARSAGAAPQEVGGNMTWSCYQGAFDEWIARIGGLNPTRRYIGSNTMHFAFFDFLNRRFDHTKYLVTDRADPNGKIVNQVDYRDSWLCPRSIYVLRQSAGE